LEQFYAKEIFCFFGKGNRVFFINYKKKKSWIVFKNNP
jgi:hypothetical protein